MTEAEKFIKAKSTFSRFDSGQETEKQGQRQTDSELHLTYFKSETSRVVKEGGGCYLSSANFYNLHVYSISFLDGKLLD